MDEKKSEKKGDPAHHNKKYVVTQTLRPHLSAFKRIGLEIPGDDVINNIEQQVIDSLEENFSGTEIEIEAIPFETFCDSILALAHEVEGSFTDTLAISTASMIALECGGKCIEVNRLIDMDGEIIGIGPRPGYPSVEKQIAGALDKLSGKDIVIVEDGAFTGGTLDYLLGIMQGRGSSVKAIVLGILFPDAEKVIRERFDGQLLCYRKADDVLDWMPSHDFFPFFPNSGRVIGGHLAGKCFPTYTEDHMSLSMPYIMPYGKPGEWASIKTNGYKAANFSRQCLTSALNIFQAMEEINGRRIMIKDLLGSYPRTNLPVSTGQHGLLSSNENVVNIIHGDLEFLS